MIGSWLMKIPTLVALLLAFLAAFLFGSSEGYSSTKVMSRSYRREVRSQISQLDLLANRMSSASRSFQRVSHSSSSRRRMSDFDFPSAMPEKPQLSTEDKLRQNADDFIESMEGSLGEGVEPPKELEELRQLRQKSSTTPSELALKIYELMIERGTQYDESPDTGTLTPTEFSIADNLEVPEVKKEFGYLYKYGMMMMKTGLLTSDQVKETVLERLIKRTGLTPEKFDTWLGY